MKQLEILIMLSIFVISLILDINNLLSLVIFLLRRSFSFMIILCNSVYCKFRTEIEIFPVFFLSDEKEKGIIK